MRQSCLMTEQLQDIKTLIEQGDTERAIHALTNFIRNDAHVNDEPYYLLGNAYRKMGDWQQALNNYLEAVSYTHLRAHEIWKPSSVIRKVRPFPPVT